MANTKEIRSKIQSVKKTRKITRAMEMVAASKMRKAQDRMFASRPYSEKIRRVIGHLAKAHPEYHHLYMQSRDIQRVGYIVVTSDRGLCGSLNNNLLKLSSTSMQAYQDKGIEVDLCLIGHKAVGYFRRQEANLIASAEHIGDTPSIEDLIGIVKVMLDNYKAKKIDCLHLVYNNFVNTMKQQPQVTRLLPLEPVDEDQLDYYWDYIYEPDAREVLTEFLTRYVESQVYQSVVENIACEQAARMVAMKSATDNAGSFIDQLQLAYNKARQAAITRELSEIVAGADAV